ncbi:MAG: lycopene cyclase family protein [Flavobacteriaceae bacterium]|jgi:lycopene beta-cyclase|nr:lycopene cyclase family protein [Flavobacteriaceae bacterium]MDO7591244.1 lycopene cyclase family protein [Flavobacteriaceae bacterium]MDO7600039.1 lycopene cyclase family protein [Flavobacteriaceae bacterium]MDO7604001.1 lycopene cyclase family protein [Flavobacteriaceae bacterium]MDO7615607.1 lycopene cyclase family protein [Flavobacteriaceae bacterium]
MENKNHFDYIICGGGASGLMLMRALCFDPFFDKKKILLLEKESKNTNDRTWCFWEEKESDWESILYKSWDFADFKAAGVDKSINLNPYKYKMIRGIDFYKKIYEELAQKSNITLINQEIVDVVDKKNHGLVRTKNESYIGDKVFSSLPNNLHLENKNKFPVLNQHFIGWFVKTEHPIFKPDTIQFMDFDLPQKGNTRFMYVLPFSENEALLEYTLFSEDLLENEEYETAIKDYLSQKNAGEFSIEDREQGAIPMTAYPFWKSNTPNIMHIGTAGGWTKASTGFTFQKTMRKTNEVVAFLKQDKALNTLIQKNRFWFYDLLFLDVLSKHNEKGHLLFSLMFKENKTDRIFKFLDEQTSFLEEIKIMMSFPAGLFVKALWKRMF